MREHSFISIKNRMFLIVCLFSIFMLDCTTKHSITSFNPDDAEITNSILRLTNTNKPFDTLLIRDKGKPRIDSVTILANPAQNPFTLKIINGPYPYYRVSSARVYLNGVEIFSPSDFNPKVGVLEKSVTLQSSNVLVLRICSKPNSALGLTFINPADTKPTIKIIEPLDKSVIATTTPKIKVTYNDYASGINPSSALISLNGVDFTKHFTITKDSAVLVIPASLALDYGKYTITASIANNANKTSATSSEFTIIENFR